MVFIHAIKYATRSVRLARKKVCKSVYVAIRNRKEIAIVWFGHVKKLAINYLHVEDIDVKLSVTVEIVANVLMDCYGRVLAVKL